MNTTVLIKTFERPDAVRRLIATVHAFAPGVPIVVIDDSHEVLNPSNLLPTDSYIKTKFDIGLSMGRNKGLEYVKTKYVVMCDDDCMFTAETNIAKAEQILEASVADILGIDAGVGYCGTFCNGGDTVRYSRAPHAEQNVGVGTVKYYDFVPNIFIARTEAVKAHKWDEELKMGEHFAYFYDHKDKIKVAFTSDVTMKHEHMSSLGYDAFRGRAIEYVKYYMRKKGLKKRVTFDGEDTV